MSKALRSNYLMGLGTQGALCLQQTVYTNHPNQVIKAVINTIQTEYQLPHPISPIVKLLTKLVPRTYVPYIKLIRYSLYLTGGGVGWGGGHQVYNPISSPYPEYSGSPGCSPMLDPIPDSYTVPMTMISTSTLMRLLSRVDDQKSTQLWEAPWPRTVQPPVPLLCYPCHGRPITNYPWCSVPMVSMYRDVGKSPQGVHIATL
ncbi:hypothetical protein G9A89_000202 [Geosiphon pyriformis]|nr:hypothetical protein G9A89_000202 [Geosiphon pyriformis]